MKLFLGEYAHAIDDRGRITLPRKIRQELGIDEVILTRGFDNCIFGYDRGSWESEATKHLASPNTDEKARNLRRYVFAAAENVSIDRLGRVLVPAQLKEYGGITGKVTVVGAGDHFEIWDETNWKRYNAKLTTT